MRASGEAAAQPRRAEGSPLIRRGGERSSTNESVVRLPTRRAPRAELEARPRDTRGEARDAGVCVVECCPFPRVSATRGWRAGFARDRSATRMCLEVDAGAPVGSLLRIVVRDIDGRPTLAALGRGSWCEEGAERARLGVELLERAPAAAPARPGLARVRRVAAADAVFAARRPA